MVVCPVCAHENAESAKFCSECGAALSAEPRREERKVVTVLFADLVGFTSRAEQLDPEDVRAVLAPYWERLRSELEKRGGTVEKFIGDAVMALFGAPAAHDDDPLRAVGAALAIRDWAREEADVQVRIAVNTGEALVLLGARPAEGEGMAAGDVVNSAARLQASAPVNGVLVGETTYRATRDVIEYADHAPVVAKGKTEPIAVWEAVQVRSRLGVDVERTTLPLVGRTRELGVIVDAFERAKSEREPQLVTLVGVPGIGKSRLVGAFFSHLEGQPDLVWWRQGRALPYGEGVSFWAVAEMVKAQAGIEENDAAEAAERKLRASVDLVVDSGDRGWVADHLLPLVGGEQRGGSGESAPAWRTFFEGLAEQRPLVLVFEDMHWADDGLLDFIDHLVDWATGVPLLVIATARPELLDRRQAWGGGKLNVSTIALTPLSDDESAQIIHNVLERSALPAETQQALLDRAGGNPLYAEQFARLYMERGSADELPMPETVQGLIAARLDGLSPPEKRLVQDAAVFGKVFWAGALDGDDDTLHSLERKGILRRERRSAVGGETQYAFRHVLLRDVAYGQIPRAQRGEKHVRAADWIESLGRAEDHAELVAHHLGSAVRLGVAVEERARPAFRLAGERAQALGAWPSAEHYFAAAIELGESGAEVVAAHAWAHARATADPSLLDGAIDGLEAAGLREEAATFAARAAFSVWYLGESARATDLVGRAHALLTGLPPSPALAAVVAESARLKIFAGNYLEGEREAAEAAGLAARFGLDELRANVLVTQGVVRLIDGDLEPAREMFVHAAELAAPGSPPLFRALANIASADMTNGDWARWRESYAVAVEAVRRAGDRANLRWLGIQEINYSKEFGDWDEAVRLTDDLFGDEPVGRDYSALLHKAGIAAARGDTAFARRVRDGAVASVEGLPEDQFVIPSLLGAAWISWILGEDADLRRIIGRVWPVVDRTRYRAPGVGARESFVVIQAGYTEQWLSRHLRNAPTRRILASRLMLEGKALEAAEAWAAVSPGDEAIARIHAAHVLGDEGQLERGLAFFRAVGAHRIVERASEPLRAAAAAE